MKEETRYEISKKDEIPEWQIALIGTIIYLMGMFLFETGVYLEGKRMQKNYDRLYSNYDRLYSRQISFLEKPIIKDVNDDGLADLVLKLNSGNDLILYKTKEGYQFENPNRKNENGS